MNAVDEARRREHATKLHAWRIENRRHQGLPPLWAAAPPAEPAPPVTVSPPAAPPPPSALDIEYERVRAAALARHEAEREAAEAEAARQEEAAATLRAYGVDVDWSPAAAAERPAGDAAASILDARARADGQLPHNEPQTGAAVSAILNAVRLASNEKE